MKRQLCILLSFVFVFSASFSFYAFGLQSDSIEKTQLGNSNTYYEFDASTGTLTISGRGAIPDMKNMDGSQPWYDWRSDGSIQSVIVGEGITAIGNYCFYSVKANSFTLPSTLKTLGRYSFSSSGIKNVSLPFGLTSIGNNAFDECTLLESVSLPDTLTSIGGYAFRRCISLTEIIIPYSVSSIGSYAFDGCTSLDSVVFDDMTSSVTLMSYAFYNCTSLLDVAFPSEAEIKTKAYGYTASGKLSGTKMLVYEFSSAYIFALTNGISYELLDEKLPLSLGIPGNVSFDDDTIDKVYTFTLKPDFSAVYNVYSRGETDVKAAIYDGETQLDFCDDISDSDRNFCLTAELTAGREYTVTVQSMKSLGASTVVVYPDVITSFDIIGELTFDAADGFRSTSYAYFPIVDVTLEGFVLDVHFEGGYSDKIYYSKGYFDNKEIEINDTQDTNRFTCGENYETVKIGEVESTFSVFVNHSYTQETVPYTLDDDGYTINTCMLCGDTYISDFVPTPARTVSGRCVLMTHPDGIYNPEIPLYNVTVTYDGNTYTTDSDGCFSFRTFNSGELTLESPYCEAKTIEIVLDEGECALSDIALPAYDFNGDGYVNGRDLARYKTRLQNELPQGYFRYAVNFM
ncbi:MAG: leucine-rich repeat domain-containing protein [Eubacterium sp.]|nr:leucine-rich repeat domain-containing protein [Eubacterium sp.]